jgi:phage baseplate assembly protein gpV
MTDGLPKSELGCKLWKGRVSSAGSKRHTLRVRFPEIDESESFDLPVLVPFGGDYVLPAPETPVVCLIFDGESGVGFVLGTFYTDSDAPPLDDKNARAIASGDLRLGDPAASDKVALAPKVNQQLQTLRDAVTAAKSAVVAQDGGLAAFTAFDTALETANWPEDVAAEKVSAK